MSYTPVLPFGGYTGWAYIARTRETQQANFAASAEVKRETDYFRDNIGEIDSAEELVKDRRLLKVALGAFGLQDDINNKYFIQKVLADGTLDTGDLANRLSNKSYLDMSSAFGFGDYTVPSTKISTFADDIIGKYEERQFEVALGEVNDTMRLALNAQRELATIAGKTTSETTKWYTVLGSPPLRQVFETAFNLPSTFAAVDLDLQLKTIRERAEQYTGSADVSQFTDPAKVESLIKMFTLRAGDSGTSAGVSSGSAALSLLQGGSSASAGLLAILAAR